MFRGGSPFNSVFIRTQKFVKKLKNSPSNQRLIKNSTFHEVTGVMAACALENGHSLSNFCLGSKKCQKFDEKTRFSLRNSCQNPKLDSYSQNHGKIEFFINFLTFFRPSKNHQFFSTFFSWLQKLFKNFFLPRQRPESGL